jgi:EAL domain-containing protein (putative c-di-GMP-specific phosphodiesterase class I)
MADPDRAMGILLRLHQMGVRLSIDDFGTGYSSLAYLKRLPVNDIKIDKSFVMGLTPGSDDAIIVHSTVEMARRLGLTVVAEGMESTATMDYLRDIGCNSAQGYFIGRPLPGPDVAGWLDHWRAGAGCALSPSSLALETFR